MNNFNWQGGSDSGKESNDDAEISKKSQKRLRGKHLSDSKALEGHFSDHSQSHSVASSDGCLSLLKKRHFGMLICQNTCEHITLLQFSHLPLHFFCFGFQPLIVTIRLMKFERLFLLLSIC